MFIAFTNSQKNIKNEVYTYLVTGIASSSIIRVIVSHFAKTKSVNWIFGEKVILSGEFKGLFSGFSTIQSKCF